MLDSPDAGGTGALLYLRNASVGEEFCASHEARVVGSKEDHHFGNFVRLPHATQRHLRSEHSIKLLPLFFIRRKTRDARSFDRSRTDDVDADLAFLQIQRPAARKGPYYRFGGGVNAEGRHSRGARCGGRHDDRPAIWHQRQRLLNGEQRTFDTRIESLIEVPFGNSAHRSEASAASISVDDVEPPFFAFDLCEELLQLIKIRAVASDRPYIAALKLPRRIPFSLSPT